MAEQLLENESELLIELGKAVMNDERYAAVDWESIALVATVYGPGASSLAGYYYDADGKATPEIPEDKSIHDKFTELRQAMKATTGKEWKSALIQIVRETGKVSAQFEYDDLNRWEATPSNFDTLPEELRPQENAA